MSEYVQKTINYVKIYNIALLVLYIVSSLCIGFLLLILSGLAGSDTTSTDIETSELVAIVAITSCMFLVFISIHAISLLFLRRQTKANWIFQLIVISLGLTSILVLPFSIILLLRWTNDEVKAYFNAR